MSDPRLSHAAATAPLPEALQVLAREIPPELGPWVERAERLRLPGQTPPWTDTGISLRASQSFSLYATGRVYWSPEGDAQWAGPRHHLWGRVGGEGPVFNPTQDTGTFRAPRDGNLELALLHGFWADWSGRLATSPKAYRHLRGEFDVLVVVWKDSADAGLDHLEAFCAGEALVQAEARRRANPVSIPQGWSYLLETGCADVYRAIETPYGPGIALDSHNDQGILRKPIARPLRDDTRLHWRWRVDEFPSAVAEDTVTTHDYVSIALEFEGGRDLTWFWSCAIEPGAHFGCPVRSWRHREIHYCVRRGVDSKGAWHAEARPVRADCAEALGETPPAIVAAWLIVVSSFQHTRARAAFADISIKDDDGVHQIL